MYENVSTKCPANIAAVTDTVPTLTWLTKVSHAEKVTYTFAPTTQLHFNEVTSVTGGVNGEESPVSFDIIQTAGSMTVTTKIDFNLVNPCKRFNYPLPKVQIKESKCASTDERCYCTTGNGFIRKATVLNSNWPATSIDDSLLNKHFLCKRFNEDVTC